ncbi:hypothetical protein K432DRAFT_427681 [Lepidopterella palustris CBS 459.81]|uniref:BZIP domain-containing protein n=1 Tax=Lepidopterella palustris CBS 459.81 TaxID=1314670 RepID=A0A8E2E5W6_9PEZI|nr:hypothetical protein K432DRAFT_427681 [Lepidopterella palustris CBS 459.81]
MPKRRAEESNLQHDEADSPEGSSSKKSKTTKDSNLSQQRARKRALDRVAQRTLREKTKKYIAYLEQTVEACKAGSESEIAKRLLIHNGELYAQIEALRKVITEVSAAVHPETWPEPLQRDVAKADAPEANISSVHQPGIAACTPATSIEGPPSLRNARVNPGPEPEPEQEPDIADESSEEHADSGHQFPFASGELRPSIPDCSSPVLNRDHYHDGRSAEDEVEKVMEQAGSEVVHIGSLESHEPFNPFGFHLLDIPQLLPSIPASKPTPSEKHVELGGLWQLTNAIFNKIFWIDSTQARQANEFNGGVIFKALSQGWHTLPERDLNNPVTQILREYDEILGKGFDIVNRLAIAYKNQHLIKYFLNSNLVNLRIMPEWQRPQPFSRVKKHPIGIYFFAWPGLRDRLLCGYPNVSMEDFSAAFQRHFRFDWPFSFEDTYHFDPDTGSYYSSPLFERYHRDLKYWTMDQEFFLRFPELVDDMSPQEASTASLQDSNAFGSVAFSRASDDTGGGGPLGVVGEASGFSGVALPEHWLSQLMSGLPSNI